MAEHKENTLHFELVSPERLLMDASVSAVLVPGSEGDFMVLPNHAPVMSTIRPGVLDVYQGKDKTPKELSKSDLRQRITDAEEDLEDAKTDEDRRKAKEAIARLNELFEAVG